MTLDTSGQLGQQDTVLCDDEIYLKALTWLEAEQKYREAGVGQLEKARKDAKEALVAKIELPSAETARFRIVKEDERRQAGQPWAVIVDVKPPGQDKEMAATTRHFTHRMTINFEDKQQD